PRPEHLELGKEHHHAEVYGVLAHLDDRILFHFGNVLQRIAEEAAILIIDDGLIGLPLLAGAGTVTHLRGSRCRAGRPARSQRSASSYRRERSDPCVRPAVRWSR